MGSVHSILTWAVTPIGLMGAMHIAMGLGVAPARVQEKLGEIGPFWDKTFGFTVPRMPAFCFVGAVKLFSAACIHGLLGPEMDVVGNITMYIPVLGALYMHANKSEPVLPPLIASSLLAARFFV
eukprot:CAMPEP_0170140204 /NCGR_PEP_ID=MMETSP0033_2-20121228/6210_1 /TAXON_ID=195969 /ORGANISM="Dolichomastix tenuilepis, Strain CCMP3274" /LENGTH=123 /DNA_ID=CAMNT_0010376405 /DNA_START=7 /DNA_END=378 /DNA_ORIENTATION=-